ncbi:MAG: ubiquinone biosynthesis protein UbiA, partial [Deltaproteobacteria bacterium]
MQTVFLEFNERLKAYFGLSRMSHSVLDIAHPSVGALVALGGFPPLAPLLIGLIAAFAGFTAVFAINDLIDWRVDTERMQKYRRESSQFDLDSLGYRHPIAQEKLRFGKALAWVFFWGLLSLSLAFVLRPLCCLMLLMAVGLEIAYCKLLRKTHWKAWLSGAMVGVGALAGIYAYKESPSMAYLVSFFVWTFAWEVGGRNIPNDWTDLEEDIHLNIRTIPVRY